MIIFSRTPIGGGGAPGRLGSGAAGGGESVDDSGNDVHHHSSSPSHHYPGDVPQWAGRRAMGFLEENYAGRTRSGNYALYFIHSFLDFFNKEACNSFTLNYNFYFLFSILKFYVIL